VDVSIASRLVEYARKNAVQLVETLTLTDLLLCHCLVVSVDVSIASSTLVVYGSIQL